jgi:hypothetical protein
MPSPMYISNTKGEKERPACGLAETGKLAIETSAGGNLSKSELSTGNPVSGFNLDVDKSDACSGGVSVGAGFVGVIEGDCVRIGVDSTLGLSLEVKIIVEVCGCVGFSDKDSCVGKATLAEKSVFLTVLFNWQALIDRSKTNTKNFFISEPPI